NDVNVVYRDVIVLDYDEINDLKQLHEAISSALSNVAWFWHTSYSHRTEQARICLYIPLNERISADDYRNYTKVLANKIGHKVDEGSYQPSRCFALPVIQKGHIFIKRVNDCPIMNVDMLEQWSKGYKQSNDSPNIKGYTRRDSAYWRDIAFGVSEGERNSTLASITGYLLRRYVDPNLVYGLVSAWASVCKPPINQSEVNNTFKSILKKDSKYS
ncbi:TPA: primase alpha helix C-terminal domain-containing protein, partial [Staphylococcus aureus]|nr:primase alpha helix C-terminal domain-containing protein [Staphylococcus aureus]HDT6400580.1 primase alpha helix C-terminal domain-containing protein [Staphylococcus aureus]HDT6403320.1 primase alpha helix C-terminal domain-containing protein [Staphylococcus aureus]HDT6408604.1 primase alpha helix C-terminal domain-containing protein [Staphylococcus aureus]HDT6411323.1 primase alpha helix C-terminal domain-containing protein [Staphylococcus aureus]